MCCRGRHCDNGKLIPGLFLLFVLSFVWGLTAKGVEPNQPSATEEALSAVQDCMTRCPPPWPQPWVQEYLDTIRQAIAINPDAPEFDRRLQILRDGFALYWPQLKNTTERSYFEVRRAEIRWYVESLMAADLPDEEERQTLRRQYEELVDYATESLSTQFSFLDPNMVRKAKVDHLAECYRNIDVPLIPIYLRRLPETQVGQMKQRWYDLRYTRVDLWRSLGGQEVGEPQDSAPHSLEVKPANEHPDYLLAQRSLDHLRGQLWSLIPAPPDYYREAVSKEIAAGKQRRQATVNSRHREEQLGVAVWQTEYLSFLLAALLETAQEDTARPSIIQDLAEPGRSRR